MKKIKIGLVCGVGLIVLLVWASLYDINRTWDNDGDQILIELRQSVNLEDWDHVSSSEFSMYRFCDDIVDSLVTLGERKIAEAEVFAIPVQNTNENMLAYEKLSNDYPDVQMYKEKYLHYYHIIEKEQAYIMAERLKESSKKAEAKSKKLRIEAENKLYQTLARGYNWRVKDAIQNRLKDPESFKLLASGAVKDGNKFLVQWNFTAKNGFGGVTRNVALCYVDIRTQRITNLVIE